MTGKSYLKTRVFLTSKLESPLSQRKSFEEAAVDFKKSVNTSSLQHSLNPAMAVKAMPGAGNKKDSDGKKRTNNGSVPGVENFGGYRYNPNEKGGEGKVFRFAASYESRINPRLQTPNWGWMDKEQEPAKKSNASIRIRKYKTNVRTGEIIEDSEKLMNPFTASGEDFFDFPEEKRLPGQTIGETMRGAGFLQRAARAAGLILDADGKMRCPPGTPAANQFTDSTGSNCFGFSANEIFDMAKRVASGLSSGADEPLLGVDGAGVLTVEQEPIKNNARGWKKILGSLKDVSRVFSEDINGRSTIPSTVQTDSTPGVAMWFKDGARRGRKSLKGMKQKVEDVIEKTGAKSTDRNDPNSDIINAFEKLRDAGVVTTSFTDRPTPNEVKDIVLALLVKRAGGIDNWKNLSEARKKQLFKTELARYYTVERAMLSQTLKSYMDFPEHMRSVDEVKWNYALTDNSSAMASWDFTGGDNNETGFGSNRTVIDICLPEILDKLSATLPSIEENERLRIDAVNASNPAEAATELNDFLVTSEAFSEETAALIGGVESFARHIMSHEINHTLQFNAILGMIKRQINEDGYLVLPDGTTVKSFNDITNRQMQQLMTSIIMEPKPGQTRTIIRELDEVVRQSQAVRWLGGKYVEFDKATDVITALETMADIATLREQGIIHGAMVDDALAWVDSYRDNRFNEERGISDAEETARFFDIIDAAESGQRIFEPISASDLDAMEERRQENEKKLRKEQIENLDSDSLIDEIADLEFEREQIDAKLNIADDPETASRGIEVDEEMALARKTWLDKNPGYKKSALDARVSRNRDEKDKLAPDALQKKKEKKELDRVMQDAESSNEEELIERIAFIEQRIRNKDTSEDDKKKLKKYKEQYRKAYRDKRKENGDESNAQKLNREIDSRVENRLNPKKKKPEQQSEAAPKTKGKKPKPIKKPKNQAATTRLAESERRRLFNEASEKEKKALVEMSDVSDKDIAKILDPETRNLAINFIRQTNDALVALGYGYDPESSEQGSLENQMDNILMPVLDIIERSELLNSVEIQIEMDLTPEQMSGDDLTPITVDGFISGNLIDEQNGVKIGGSITWSRKTGRGKQRVVVQLEEGQRGYYPHWSDSSEERPDNFVQKVVSPPGRIEIVERRQEKDGSTTFIARVVEQKNTEEILDGILTSDPNNEIPPAAKLQIEKSVNKHIVERRSRGLHNEQKTPSSVKEVIEDKNNQSFDDVNDSGGSFGEPIDADYADSVSELEDGPDEASEEMFGKPQTREERRKDRVEKFAEITKALQELFESKESNEELGISFEDIDPEIIDLINNTSPAELEDILADEAEKVHEEIDKRPRVNVWETGLEEIIEKPSPTTEQKPAPNTGRPTVGKKRTKATQAIENVVGNGANRNQASARAENELNRIQSLLDGDDYTNYGGRGAYTARNIIQGKFGTTNLRELTNEQISEVIDELKNLSYANPANQGRQIGQMASRLHDFLDIRDMQNSRDYSDPYDRFKIDSLRTLESPSLIDDGLDVINPSDGWPAPYRGGSLSSGKGGMGRGIAARVATRLVSSQIDKTDMSDETKEKVKLATGLIASYAAKGPQGAATTLAIEAARRGGREVAELTIDKLVKTGKMTPDQARIAMQAVDKIAPEGVPDSVMEALSDGFDVVDRFVDERVLTDENKERLINATEEARDAAGRAREQIGESARGASSAAKEKLNLLKRKAKGNREKEIPSIDDAIYDAFDNDDPFADPPTSTPAQPAAAARSAFDEYDIFGDVISSPEASPEPESRQRRIRRAKKRLVEDLRREEASQDDDPFADYLIPPTSRASSSDPFSDDPFDAFTTAGRSGLSSGASRTTGLSSGASRSETRQGRKLADKVIARDKGGTDNSTNPLDYIPLGPASVDSLLKKNPFSRNPKGGRGKAAELIDDLSVDWNATAEMASVLSEIMSTNRGMQSLVREFGMPAIFVSQLIPLPDRDSSSGVSAKYWGGAYGVYSAHQGIIAINPEVMRDRYKLEHVLRHELAHAFHSMAAARSGKARKKMEEYTTGVISEAVYQGEQSGGDLSLANFDDIGQLTPEMKEAADFMNNFGFIVASQNVMEFVAEVTTYLTSPNESDRNKVSQRAITITAEYFGLSESEFKELIKYQDMFDSGFTSRGENTSPAGSGSAPGTPTPQSSFNDPFGDSPISTDSEPEVREGGRLFRRRKGKESVPANVPDDDPFADWDPFADPTPARTGLSSGANTPDGKSPEDIPRKVKPLVIPGVGKVSDSGLLSSIEIDSSTKRGKLKTRSSGLSSGAKATPLSPSAAQGKAVERNLTRGALDENPGEIKTKISDITQGSAKREAAQLWTIGDKKIVFGLTDSIDWQDDTEFESIPINPYEISGYSETSKEGKEFADKWIFARMQHDNERDIQDNVPYDVSTSRKGDSSYVDALLYAASRGDQGAAEKLDDLAARGRKVVEQERKKILDAERERADKRRAAISAERMDDLGLDDLFVVHETKYETQTDENGDIILRPHGDYEMLDEDGNPKIDKDGIPFDFYRDSIHFAVNHVVDGHVMRASSGDSNVIIVPLRSVVEANQGSLDTMYTVDTYFTPSPGQPLKLPGAIVIKNTGQSSLSKEVSDAMIGMGGKGRIFEGGEHYSTPGADTVVKNVGLELGVTAYGLHANLPATKLERIRKHQQMNFVVDAMDLAKMSENARLRVANDNRFYALRNDAVSKEERETWQKAKRAAELAERPGSTDL